MGNCFRACVLKNIDYVAHMFQNNPCVYNFSKINTNVEHKPMNSTGPSKIPSVLLVTTTSQSFNDLIRNFLTARALKHF